jgi:hypothetical protein
MPTRVALALSAALVTVLTSLGAAAARPASPHVTIDVVAWPGEAPGPLEWKVWRVAADAPMRSITVQVPAGAVRTAALAALASMPQPAGGRRAGTATVTLQRAAGRRARTRPEVTVGGCPGGSAGELVTFRFLASGACANVTVDASPAGPIVGVDVPPQLALVALDLRLESLQTPAGRLLPANPEQAWTADTFATAETDAGTAADTVRELVGGATEVTVAPGRWTVGYGRRVELSGVVRRGGEPAPGERVALQAVDGSVANVPARPAAIAVTDAEGGFSTTLRPTSSGRVGAWAAAPPDGARPRLNTLATVARSVLRVRAPRPPIRKRIVRRLRGGLVRAVIVVRNPLVRVAALRCRLYVANRKVADRRFPRGRSRLVFRVVGHRHAKVRAVIGRWNKPAIAARSSRTLRLLPRPARRRG